MAEEVSTLAPSRVPDERGADLSVSGYFDATVHICRSCVVTVGQFDSCVDQDLEIRSESEEKALFHGTWKGPTCNPEPLLRPVLVGRPSLLPHKSSYVLIKVFTALSLADHYVPQL
jgi:hypothetical protein